MLKTKVKNMVSQNGNDVPNQFIITTNQGVYFQSYESVIAFLPNGHYKPSDDKLHSSTYNNQLDATYWNYSRTTLKYLTQFLREKTGEAINTKKDIEKLIKSGQYILTNLN